MVQSASLASRPIDTVLLVDTPEHLAFQVRIAGPARRFSAWMIDLFVRGLIATGVTFAVIIVFGSLGEGGFGAGLTYLLMFFLEWGYFFAFEVLTGGRSAGKMALKLRVVRSNGLPITWRESMLRNLLRAADLAIVPTRFVLPLAPIVMALDERFRRIGDLVAGTIVVLEEPVAVASKKPIPPDPELVAELPSSLPLDHDDLESLELFVHRQQMSDARREELAEIVAPEYARRLSLPKPRVARSFLASLWVRAQDPTRRMTQ